MFSSLKETPVTNTLKYIRDGIEAIRENKPIPFHAFKLQEQRVIFSDIIVQVTNSVEDGKELKRNLEESNSKLATTTTKLTEAEILNTTLTQENEDVKTQLQEVEEALVKAMKYETQNKILTLEHNIVKSKYQVLSQDYNYMKRYKMENQKIKDDLEKSTQVRNDLQNNIEVLRNTVRECEKEKETLVRDSSYQTLLHYRTENEKITDDLKRATQTLNDLQNKLKEHEIEKETLTREYNSMQSIYHRSLWDDNPVKMENQKLKEELGRVTQIRNDLQDNVATLENEIRERERKEETLILMCSSVETYKEENQKTTEKLKESEELNVRLQNNIEILQKNIEEYEAEKQSLVLNCNATKKIEDDNETVAEELKAAKKAFSNLQNKLKHTESEMKQLSGQKKALLGELDAATNRETLKDESIRSLKEAISNQNQNSDKYNKTGGTPREQVQELQRKYQRVVEENKKLKYETDRYCDIIAKTDQTVNNLNINLNEQRKQIFKQNKFIKFLKRKNYQGNLSRSKSVGDVNATDSPFPPKKSGMYTLIKFRKRIL